MEVEFNEKVYELISDFIQSNSPAHFVKPSERGVNVANVLAKHLGNSDPYDRN